MSEQSRTLRITIPPAVHFANEAGQRRGEDLAKQAGKAGKEVITLQTAEMEGHKDLNEYWAAKRELPAGLGDR